MRFPRRTFMHLAAGAAALPAMAPASLAQTYPSRPARIVVGFPAGGATDIMARLMSDWLTERTGQQFIVENKPGASGSIGTETVAKAAPDGYTLLQVVTPNAINPALFGNLPFDFVRDFVPVIYLARLAYVVVVNPSVPATTLPELIAYAKANPGKINYGSAGAGTPQNITCELFKMMTGVNLVHVPYKGGAPAVADLLDPADQGRQAARARGDAGRPSRRSGGRSHGRGVRAGLRGERLRRHQRAPGYTGRDRRFSEQTAQCRARRPQDQGPHRRAGRYADRRHARGVRQDRRRGHREVGQGDQGRGHQGGVGRGNRIGPC
jgi:hypothetical protein